MKNGYWILVKKIKKADNFLTGVNHGGGREKWGGGGKVKDARFQELEFDDFIACQCGPHCYNPYISKRQMYFQQYYMK